MSHLQDILKLQCKSYPDRRLWSWKHSRYRKLPHPPRTFCLLRNFLLTFVRIQIFRISLRIFTWNSALTYVFRITTSRTLPTIHSLSWSRNTTLIFIRCTALTFIRCTTRTLSKTTWIVTQPGFFLTVNLIKSVGMFCVLNGTKFVCFLASSMGPRDPVARVNFVLQLMKTVG